VTGAQGDDPGSAPEPGPDGEAPVAGQGDASETGALAGIRGKEVVVPMRIYKTVTVFSTLFAIAGVVVGFVLLDVGTQRASVGSLSEANLGIVVLGLAAILFSAAVYAYSTRFQPEGMGKAKTDTDQGTDDG